MAVLMDQRLPKKRRNKLVEFVAHFYSFLFMFLGESSFNNSTSSSVLTILEVSLTLQIPIVYLESDRDQHRIGTLIIVHGMALILKPSLIFKLIRGCWQAMEWSSTLIIHPCMTFK